MERPQPGNEIDTALRKLGESRAALEDREVERIDTRGRVARAIINFRIGLAEKRVDRNRTRLDWLISQGQRPSSRTALESPNAEVLVDAE